ncbi:MAG: helix-turn-helix transcriptional regulator [Candidatus Aminicenantes bacterium]|nr:MAG: helix-turn-helix transcriptional regulator [Candidatus Aminicenantes bacterium]
MAKTKKENNLEAAKAFGQRLRAVRKHLKLRQEDFVKGVKISTTHLSDIEKGKTKPCHDFFYNIVKSYNVNLYYLLFGEGDMFVGSLDEIVTDGKRIKTGNKNIDEFLYHFFNSRMVQSYVLFHFWKLYEDEQLAMKKYRGSSEDEE